MKQKNPKLLSPSEISLTPSLAQFGSDWRACDVHYTMFLGIRRSRRHFMFRNIFLARWILPHRQRHCSPCVLRDGGPGVAAGSSEPVITSMIILAFIIEAVGRGCLILALRLQLQVDISAACPSLCADDSVIDMSLCWPVKWSSRWPRPMLQDRAEAELAA